MRNESDEEFLDEMGNAVSGNRIHADDHQRKGPLRSRFTSITQQNAARKRKQTPPLNSVQLGVQMRFTTGQMPVSGEESGGDADDAGDQEASSGELRSRSRNQRPRNQSQNHGAQRGNEAECQIAAGVDRPMAFRGGTGSGTIDRTRCPGWGSCSSARQSR